MYPHLSADLATAHIADLVREAAATCCVRVARHPVSDRIRATVRRAGAALHRSRGGVAPRCCPA